MLAVQFEKTDLSEITTESNFSIETDIEGMKNEFKRY
jgi:hypothetical protein